MKNLKKIALIIFSIALHSTPALADSSKNADLTGLIIIAEESEDPIDEQFFHTRERPRQKMDLDRLKPIAVDEEPAVNDVKFSEEDELEIRLNQLTPVAQEPETSVEDLSFMTEKGRE